MHWDTSSEMYPGFIGCFRSCNIRHSHQGDPARNYQSPTCIPAAVVHGSPLLIESHVEALSAPSVMVLMARIFTAPVRVKTLLSEQPVKPLQLTSTEWQQARHSWLQHWSRGSWYFACLLLCASFMQSSNGTVSSNMTSCFVTFDRIMISGHCAVVAMCAGHLRCLPTSANSC